MFSNYNHNKINASLLALSGRLRQRRSFARAKLFDWIDRTLYNVTLTVYFTVKRTTTWFVYDIQVKTLKFKLYQHKRNRHLKRAINAAGVIYNHCIALHRRYYGMWGKHLSCAKLQSHIAKLRKCIPFWQSVGSQAVQDICQRIEKAYQLFFKHNKKGVRPPGFRKVKKYKSFTLKQAGYKFLSGNRIKIGSRVYRFWKSREIEGAVKTLTIKRTPLGELFMVIVVDDGSNPEVEINTGKIAGFDFGLKTFLTCSDGTKNVWKHSHFTVFLISFHNLSIGLTSGLCGG